MADEADARLKALNASMKEALGKLTGSDELEAQGARERARGAAHSATKRATPATKAPKSRGAKARPKRSS